MDNVIAKMQRSLVCSYKVMYDIFLSVSYMDRRTYCPGDTSKFEETGKGIGTTSLLKKDVIYIICRVGVNDAELITNHVMCKLGDIRLSVNYKPKGMWEKEPHSLREQTMRGRPH